MTRKVEEVARVIYDAPTSFDGDTIATHLCTSMMIDASSRNKHEMLEIVRSVCRDAARAAIGAMISPTPEMIAAADEAMRHRRMDGEERLVTLRDGIAAAIDAALSEECE